MAGGTFKLSQPKVRPGVYANLKNGRQPTASGSARGTASIPLIGYDWGPRGKWIIISADSPDGHVAELGRSIYDETNSSMIMLQLLLLNAATVYVYIPDGGAAAKKTITVGSGSLTVTAKYKGTLGNTVKIVSVANPVDGFDVSVVINGSEVELFEGIKTMDELRGVSEYVDFSGTGDMAAFASATLEGGTDTVDGSGNSGISDFLDKSEKVRFNCMCFPSTESSLQTALLTKIKYIRESIGWKCQAVAPNFAADYEGIINLVNSFVYGDRSLTTAEACAWLAGATAGADYVTSLTYAQVRYMDDIIILSDSKEQLHMWKDEIQKFVETTLRLSLNQKTCIRPISQGIEFVGYRIWPHYVTIRKSTTLEMKRHLRRKVEEYNAGLIEMEVVTATLKSYLGMLDHCDCKEFRKELIDSVVLDRNKVVGEIAYEVENYSEAMVCGL